MFRYVAKFKSSILVKMSIKMRKIIVLKRLMAEKQEESMQLTITVCRM